MYIIYDPNKKKKERRQSIGVRWVWVCILSRIAVLQDEVEVQEKVEVQVEFCLEIDAHQVCQKGVPTHPNHSLETQAHPTLSKVFRVGRHSLVQSIPLKAI